MYISCVTIRTTRTSAMFRVVIHGEWSSKPTGPDNPKESCGKCVSYEFLWHCYSRIIGRLRKFFYYELRIPVYEVIVRDMERIGCMPTLYTCCRKRKESAMCSRVIKVTQCFSLLIDITLHRSVGHDESVWHQFDIVLNMLNKTTALKFHRFVHDSLLQLLWKILSTRTSRVSSSTRHCGHSYPWYGWNSFLASR